MSLFFVTIGANAGSITALLQTGWLTAFIALQLAIHLGVTLLCGRLLNIPMQVICLASKEISHLLSVKSIFLVSNRVLMPDPKGIVL